MKLFKIHFLCLVSMVISQNAMAQHNSKVKGNIYDKQTKTALPFVNVIVQNTQRGTMADDNGHYELQLAAGNYELLFSMMGYKTDRLRIKLLENKSYSFNVYLSQTVLYMPGVTIIASKTAQQKQSESVSSFAFKTKKIKDLPFSLNDVNRALKTLPGISSNNEKSSEFNVRGGSFEENLVLVDGVTIYRPFHLKALPNASISILNMALMEKVNLITGGFPAKFGDKMSSVLEIDYRNGNLDKFQTQIEIGAVNTNILLEGPLHRNCSFILGFNKSYFEPSIKIMNKYFPEFLEEVSGTPKFYDLQGKIGYKINHNHKLSLFFLNANDKYCEVPDYESDYYTRDFSSTYTKMNTQYRSEFESDFSNTLWALKISNQIIKPLLSQTAISYYDEMEDLLTWSEYTVINKYYNLDDDKYRGFSNYNNVDQYGLDLQIKTYELKNDLIYKITPYHELEVGLNIQNIRYRYHLKDISERIAFHNVFNYPDTTRIDTLFYDDNYYDTIDLESRTYKIGGYLQENWQISNNIFANAGLRYDYFEFNRNANFSPRISCSYTFNNGGIFKLAWGHYYQSPLYHELKFNTSRSDNTQNQKAVHYIAGYQQNITNLFDFKIDYYYKDYQKLIPYDLRSGYKLSTQQNNAYGFARGIDIQLKFNLSSLSGWLCYGFMIAKENNKDDDLGYYPRSTDQRHSLAMICDWNITDRWRFYGKFLYGSGFPYTPFTFDLESQRFVVGAMNSEYLPAYKRLDLRISRYFYFTWCNCNIYFEIINVLNNKKIFTFQHYGIDEYGNVTKKAKKLLPFTPNIGIKICL